MKILLVEPYGHLPGHYSTYSQRLCEGLISKGHQMTVMSSRGFLGQWPRQLGISSEQLFYKASRNGRKGFSHKLGRYYPLFVEPLRVELAAFRKAVRQSFDVVHFVGSELVTLDLLHLWYQRRVPNVVVSLFGSIYYPERKADWSFKGKVYVALRLRVLKRLLRRKVKFIVKTPQIQALWEEIGAVRSGCDSVFVVPEIGVPGMQSSLDQCTAREKLGIQYGGKALLFFGTMRPSKGLITLLETLDSVDEQCMLIVAGYPGDFERQIRDLCSRRGAKHLIFLDLRYIPEEEAKYYFIAADAVILPYYGNHKGGSGVLTTACGYGVPVICSRVGFIGDLVNDHGLGFTFEPDNPARLREAIHRFLALDSVELDSLRTQVMEYSSQNPLTQEIDKYIEVYKTEVGV